MENISKNVIETIIEETVKKYYDGKLGNNDFLNNICFAINDYNGYELLEYNVEKKISIILLEIWDLNKFYKNEDINMIDKIFYIVINLGLQDCYVKIKKDVDVSNKDNIAVYNYINSILCMNGDDISNPYRKVK